MDATPPILGHNEGAPVRDIQFLLKARPDHEYFSESQAEARQWMEEFKVLNDIPACASNQPFVGVGDSCPSHWIIIRIVRGHADGRCDGFYVTLSPRKGMPAEEVKARVLAMYGGQPVVNRKAR